MKYFSYIAFRFLVFVFSLLPFSVVYMLSDLLALVFRKVLRYRYNTVLENLDRVYPKITDKEKRKLVKAIYKNLADISVESIKGLSMNKDDLLSRHYCTNPGLLDEAYAQNKSIILATGHYGNWEWGAFSPNFYLKHKIIGFYKPLTNSYINKYIEKRRARWGCILADINNTSAFYEKFHNATSVFLIAGDQAPTKPKYAIWTNFLGQETACVHGIEKYISKYDLAVVYCYIRRKKRGYYNLTLEWINDINAAVPEYGDTTKKYMKMLEKEIMSEPSPWLWTHRRWKHDPKDYKQDETFYKDPL